MHRMFRRLLPLVALCCAVPLAAPVGAEEEYVGSETCAACHDEIAAAFARTPHARSPYWDEERGCESCHGPGTAHVEEGGDPARIVRFGELSARQASETCLSCHRKQEAHFSSMQSLHRLGDVGCNDCHDPHGSHDKLLRAEGSELCSRCHQAIAAQFDLPRSHPIAECAKCHNPHATKSLRTDRSLFRDTCGDCHFDKAVPYVYSHDVVFVDGCAACHEVHGSPNRHLLKHEPQVNLCYQCHSASVTPGWHSVPRFLNEKCTACHTAIHGSNTSPFFLEE